MCGIAGLADFDGRAVDAALLDRMCDALRHRGPDDGGTVVWPPAGRSATAAAGLGNRRLSIVDVQGGHQPIANETGEIWTVLNGEIYNHEALRERLIALGHRFATRADTEVVVHAYEQYGDACLEHLDGMFALAVWDGNRERLLLARDRFGKKPLCYWHDGARLAFASELQALTLAPGLPRAIDPEALSDYLAYMSVPAPRTIYRAVRKVPPAHVVIADRRGIEVRSYWQLDYTPKREISEQDAAMRVRELLTAAVKRRLMSEVPLGAFLSGGVDSSAVVAVMASLSDQPVRTFSIGFDDAPYNELPHARRIAQRFGCVHEEFIVRPDAVEILPGLVRHFGEPFADSSAIPTAYLAKLTRGHVTVALSGDGGDEIFGGYGRHFASSVAEHWAVRAAARVAGRAGADPRRPSRLARFLDAAAGTRAERYRRWAGVFTPEAIAALAPGAASGQGTVQQAFDDVRTLDAIDAMLAVDTRVYLPTDLLVKMDITTMMFSLEARSPLLDRELAEFVARLPTRMKVQRGSTKHLLKKAMTGLLPDDILRRPKRGFAVPIGGWFRGALRDYANDHLRASRAAAAGLVDQRAVSAVLDEHLSGTRDRAHEVWTLLMLELWYRLSVAV